MLNSNTRREFLIAVRAKIAEAEQMYNVDFSDVAIELNIRGNRIAGQCCPAGFRRRSRKFHTAKLRFNPNAINEHYTNMVKRTVPHEIAHMVCAKRRELGRNHDRGWQRVDISLGGDGTRCHDMDFGGAITRTTKKFNYRTTTGQAVTLSSVRHKRVQQGTIYTLKSDRSQINKSGFINQTV